MIWGGGGYLKLHNPLFTEWFLVCCNKTRSSSCFLCSLWCRTGSQVSVLWHQGERLDLSLCEKCKKKKTNQLFHTLLLDPMSLLWGGGEGDMSPYWKASLWARRMVVQVYSGLFFPKLRLFFLQKQCDSKWIAQEMRKPPVFSGCGPEHPGLHNALTDSNRLLKTYCCSLNLVLCTFSSLWERIGTILPRIQHICLVHRVTQQPWSWRQS